MTLQINERELGPSGSTEAPAAPAPSGPSPRDGLRSAVRRARWPIVIVVLLLLAVLVTVLANGSGNDEPLDPDGVGPDGAKALAQVLSSHGVQVRVETTGSGLQAALAAQPTATVLVARTDLLGSSDVSALRQFVAGPQQSRRLVLVAPSPAQLAALAPDVRIAGVAPRQTADSHCADPVALGAGAADAGGFGYVDDQNNPATECYPVDGHPSYVVDGLGPQVVVIGQPRLLTNDRLAKQGNASLMVGTLGTTGSLVWYTPTGEDVGAQQHSLTSLLPGWVGWVTVELFVAVGVCLVWRGRRLGRLVPEPLRVVVRAVETTEGRARMYRRARARGLAAAQLREAALQRLRDHLGLPHSAPPTDVVAVVETRTGLPARSAAEILTGPPPDDDAGLVRLAQTLDQLDREVRRP